MEQQTINSPEEFEKWKQQVISQYPNQSIDSIDSFNYCDSPQKYPCVVVWTATYPNDYFQLEWTIVEMETA